MHTAQHSPCSPAVDLQADVRVKRGVEDEAWAVRRQPRVHRRQRGGQHAVDLRQTGAGQGRQVDEWVRGAGVYSPPATHTSAQPTAVGPPLTSSAGVTATSSGVAILISMSNATLGGMAANTCTG